MKNNQETMTILKGIETERMLQEQSEARRKIIEYMDDRAILEYIIASCARIEDRLNELEAERGGLNER